MIKYKSDDDIEVTYTTSKAKVYTSLSWSEMMNFIINNRPMVVHQFWIDKQNSGDIFNMLYSKVTPAPDDICDI
jgi:hypothetical protein